MNEPNEVLVMTTCKCRENTKNLVMTRTWFEEQLQNKIEQGIKQERKQIIESLQSEICRGCEIFGIENDCRDMYCISTRQTIDFIEGKEND